MDQGEAGELSSSVMHFRGGRCVDISGYTIPFVTDIIDLFKRLLSIKHVVDSTYLLSALSGSKRHCRGVAMRSFENHQRSRTLHTKPDVTSTLHTIRISNQF